MYDITTGELLLRKPSSDISHITNHFYYQVFKHNDFNEMTETMSVQFVIDRLKVNSGKNND